MSQQTELRQHLTNIYPVPKNDVKAEAKAETVLTESKEVTGNKTETANVHDEGTSIEIKRSPGLN